MNVLRSNPKRLLVVVLAGSLSLLSTPVVHATPVDDIQDQVDNLCIKSVPRGYTAQNGEDGRSTVPHDSDHDVWIGTSSKCESDPGLLAEAAFYHGEAVEWIIMEALCVLEDTHCRE